MLKHSLFGVSERLLCYWTEEFELIVESKPEFRELYPHRNAMFLFCELLLDRFISKFPFSDSKVWHFRTKNFSLLFAVSEIRLHNQSFNEVQMKGISDKKKDSLTGTFAKVLPNCGSPNAKKNENLQILH